MLVNKNYVIAQKDKKIKNKKIKIRKIFEIRK